MAGRSIGYQVPSIPQTTVMGCWAAGVAMILGWRDRISIDPGTIARNPGGVPYLNQLQTGLDPNDIYILRRWGLKVEAPQCYTVEGFAQLLERHGPLWVAARLPTIPAHIRVVTGMQVDPNPRVARVYVNDPWQVGMRVFPGRIGGHGITVPTVDSWPRSRIWAVPRCENHGRFT